MSRATAAATLPFYDHRPIGIPQQRLICPACGQPKKGRVAGMHRACYARVRSVQAERRSRGSWAPFVSAAFFVAALLRPVKLTPGPSSPADFLDTAAVEVYERRVRDFRFSTTEITAAEFVRRSGLERCADSVILALRHDRRLARVVGAGPERYRRVRAAGVD